MNINKWIFFALLFLVMVGFKPAESLSAQTGQMGKLWVSSTDDDSNPRWATLADFENPGLVFCRGYYEQSLSEDGVYGWFVDYPGLDYNFLVRLSELTKVRVNFDAKKDPVYVVVRLDSPLLFKCPVLFLSDVGTIGLTESEINNLRAYIKKGGFLWVDDFWGSAGWNHWESQIGKVLTPSFYPIIDIPKNHPIMHQFLNVFEIPQIPSIGFWYGNKRTSERGDDSKDVHFRGIEDSRGRLIVVMTHNTDIGDALERVAYDTGEYFYKFSPIGYAIAINIFLYALTH